MSEWVVTVRKVKGGYNIWDCAIVEAESRDDIIAAVNAHPWPFPVYAGEKQKSVTIMIESIRAMEKFREDRYIVSDKKELHTDKVKVKGRKRTRAAPKPSGAGTVSRRSGRRSI